MKNPTLLCVDDDLAILEFYETMLGNHGYDVLLAKDGLQALAVFREKVKEIDAVISDYEMPGRNGIELAAELKRHRATLPVLMISGCVPLVDGTRHTVDALFSKGVPVEEILARVEFLLCLSAKRVRARFLELRCRFLGIPCQLFGFQKQRSQWRQPQTERPWPSVCRLRLGLYPS